MTHSATLAWVDSTDAGSQYNVYRSQTSGTYTTPINSTPLAAGTTTFIDTPLSPGTYFWVVTSVLNGAESVHSSEVSGRVLPAAPTGLVITSIS